MSDEPPPGASGSAPTPRGEDSADDEFGPIVRKMGKDLERIADGVDRLNVKTADLIMKLGRLTG